MTDVEPKKQNADRQVIECFGVEWEEFDYSSAPAEEELRQSWDQYFHIFPWSAVTKQSEGFDMGCGTGRWARFVAPKVGTLNCIDPSHAIEVAKHNLASFSNVRFLNETTEACTLGDETQDFGYCLGVLHHIPDTQKGLDDCARILKPGAPFLLYLYYRLENKPLWFRLTWRSSDMVRRFISRTPNVIKKGLCSSIAALIYFPLARLARLLASCGLDVTNMPLSDYRHKPYYQMQNDSLDRFGTRLEQRFSRAEIEGMLGKAGFENIVFSERTPYWCCVSYKK
ncbi:MAG: class I SAM-dependent methyltransferase [Alphaproteobacteria bacterium]